MRNSAHEQLLAKLIEEECPAIPYTLSHEINPIVREYRRASSTAIDASLKPVMSEHFRSVESDLREAGFSGELIVVTCAGGAMLLADAAARPIYAIDSGPSVAPVAARFLSRAEGDAPAVIVCDAGGTTFDVSLLRHGVISRTRERWLGPPFQGHMLGLSAVDVNSVGAGGGSIAWVDEGGLLHVGPQSAGATPGPASFGQGGSAATVTDAAVALGYFQPDTFLAGRIHLDREAAINALDEHVAAPLGLDVLEAARAVLQLANETMVISIRDVTVNRGVDPRDCVLLAGGGAGGLGAAPIARSLGSDHVLVPASAGTLSAFGAVVSELVWETSASGILRASSFDFAFAEALLEALDARLSDVARRLAAHRVRVTELSREYHVAARYASQVWDLDVPLENGRLDDGALAEVVRRFHDLHEAAFAVSQQEEDVEFQHWHGRLIGTLATPDLPIRSETTTPVTFSRLASFEGFGELETTFYDGTTLPAGMLIAGPAVIVEPTATLVVTPADRVQVTRYGNYRVDVSAATAT